MNIRWQGIKDALTPFIVCRRYKVTCTGYSSGFFKNFWSLKNARKYFEKVKADFPFVVLNDLFLGENHAPLTLDETDNRDKFPVPPAGKKQPGYFYDAKG